MDRQREKRGFHKENGGAWAQTTLRMRGKPSRQDQAKMHGRGPLADGLRRSNAFWRENSAQSLAQEAAAGKSCQARDVLA